MNKILVTAFLCFLANITPIISIQKVAHAILSTKIFYVSVDGNDKWTGTLSSKNSSESDGPFATLQQARNAIRNLKNNGSKDSFTVVVRGGIYRFNETLTFGPEDSGTQSNPLIIRAFNDEHPILTGSKKIDKFIPYQGRIYQADLTNIIDQSNSIKQLFSNGKRQILARYPDFDQINTIGGGFLYVDSPVCVGSRTDFRYQGDFFPKWINLKGSEVVIYPGNNWGKDTLTVSRIDYNNRTITLSKDTSNEIKSYNRYYIQNIFEGLDSPGEWYFNGQNRKLYFMPSNDAELQSVYIPVLQSIVVIKGRDIRFEGFTLEGCEGSALVVQDGKRVIISNNTIYNAGGCGIELLYGFENIAVGNDIYEVGRDGIYVSGGDRKTLSPANNRAENNYVYHVGTGTSLGSGIFCNGVGNVISHNLIHSTPRSGIRLDGNDHLIEYNHIYDTNRETQDSGIIYCIGIDWTKRGNVIRFNYLHDSGGYGRDGLNGEWKAPFDTFGIYLDDWLSGTNVYGNIVSNTVNGGIFIHGGRDNIVENNVIIEGGKLGQMIYSAWLPSSPTAQKWLSVMFKKIEEMKYTKYPLLLKIRDVNEASKMSGNHFLRNIIYYSDQKAPLYGIYNDIDIATTLSDYNIIYHHGFPLLIPYTKVETHLQWAEWKKNGFEKNSVIIDQVISVSTAEMIKNFSASSLLWEGFKPIPVDKIGLYNNPPRASWIFQKNTAINGNNK